MNKVEAVSGRLCGSADHGTGSQLVPGCGDSASTLQHTTYLANIKAPEPELYYQLLVLAQPLREPQQVRMLPLFIH